MLMQTSCGRYGTNTCAGVPLRSKSLIQRELCMIRSGKSRAALGELGQPVSVYKAVEIWQFNAQKISDFVKYSVAFDISQGTSHTKARC